MENYKKTVSFIDADKHRAIIELEITDRNGYPEFTASGSYLNSGGQCLDQIKPRTQAQRKLIYLWENYHLNGMSAGTKEQDEAIKKWQADNKYDFGKACEYLKSIGLYEVKHPKTGELYKYGSGWIREDLSSTFLIGLKSIVFEIEKEEREREKEEAKKEKTEDEILAQKMEEFGIDEDLTDACRAYLDAMNVDDLSDFEESYSGKFNNDEDFAQDMAENIGAIDMDAKWPNNCIDWEKASSQLMQDYTEQDGFYFRN